MGAGPSHGLRGILRSSGDAQHGCRCCTSCGPVDGWPGWKGGAAWSP
jgi:hypothetical protein